MKTFTSLTALMLGCSLLLAQVPVGGQKDSDWQTDFPVEKGELSSTGRNPFFILEPGYVLILEKGDEKMVITVLDETKMIGDVETRVVEEKETKAGQPVEFARNFFAISKKTKNVYYFGEEVDVYKDGKVVGHPGTFLHGTKGAKFGLMMPGKVLLKAKYYQEQAPKDAMDRAEHISLTETVETPAGTFKNCLKVEETTPLEPATKEYKYYAEGVGLVADTSMKLTKYGFLNKGK